MADTDGLRVLHIIATVDPASGGPIEGILRQQEVVGSSRAREIVSLDEPGSPFLVDFPMKVHALGARRARRGLLGRWGYAPDFVPWLRNNLSSFDAVIVNGLWNFASFGASLVLPGSRTPYFVFTHGMLDPWFRRTYPLKHIAKQLFWLVGEGRLLRDARAVLFTAEEERELARGSFWGYRYAEKVVGYGTTAPPPIADDESQAFNATVQLLGAARYLLFLGRIHPKKGCDILIEAFAEVAELDQELQLVFAGPDFANWTSELKRKAVALGIEDRVHWAGMLKGSAKWGAIRRAEAFCLPSHQENFGIAVAEALASSVPVLVSNKVNIWREIEAAGAGFVGTDTVHGAADMLRRWIGLSAVERREMARASRELFDEKFNIEKTAPELTLFLESEAKL